MSSSARRSAFSSVVARGHAVRRHDVREHVHLDFVAQERRTVLRHRVADEHEQAGEALVVVLRPERVALERRSALRAGELDVVASGAGPLERLLAASRLGARVDAVPDLFLRRRRLLAAGHAADADTISSTASAAPNNGILRDMSFSPCYCAFARSMTMGSSCSGVRLSSFAPLGNLLACSRYATRSTYAPVPGCPACPSASNASPCRTDP